MFTSGFFPQAYFPRGYFPEVASAAGTGAPYFPHGFFARTFFPDPYFPGGDAAPVPPTPPDLESGGGARRDAIPGIHARVRLFVPPFVLQVRGQATPADAAVRLQAQVHAAIEALIRGEAQPADVFALAITLGLSAAEAALIVAASAPVRSARRTNDDDDEELLEYWSTLKH